MKISTRDFGEISINEADIIRFKQPIFGFDEYEKYVFIYEEDSDRDFVRLQSIDEPQLCFVLANPLIINDKYETERTKELELYLGKGEYSSWFMMVVPDDITKSTINLKSPIVLNRSNNYAMQVILEEDLPIRYPLFSTEGGK